MSWGTWLFGAAVSVVVIAYVARPFRRDALDVRIEAWIAATRRESDR